MEEMSRDTTYNTDIEIEMQTDNEDYVDQDLESIPLLPRDELDTYLINQQNISQARLARRQALNRT